jgi:hypothetical protein
VVGSYWIKRDFGRKQARRVVTHGIFLDYCNRPNHRINLRTLMHNRCDVVFTHIVEPRKDPVLNITVVFAIYEPEIVK